LNVDQLKSLKRVVVIEQPATASGDGRRDTELDLVDESRA
jgi:hypothetical protein